MTKSEFRRTKEWKSFRDTVCMSQKNCDFLTGYKLRKGYNVHHLDMRDENYDNLDPDRFVALNKATHETIHFLYNYYEKDPDILIRIKNLLDNMIKFNQDKVEGSNKCQD